MHKITLIFYAIFIDSYFISIIFDMSRLTNRLQR